MSRNRKITYEINENGCHVCTSHKPNDSGYPRVMINKSMTTIYRHLFIEKHGEIDSGNVIRHKCDNTMCINVDHLEIGTHQDNMDDMVERGRSLKGEKNVQAILSEEDVLSIRKDKTSTNKSLGKIYGVSHSTISAIRLRKIWKHI